MSYKQVSYKFLVQHQISDPTRGAFSKGPFFYPCAIVDFKGPTDLTINDDLVEDEEIEVDKENTKHKLNIY